METGREQGADTQRHSPGCLLPDMLLNILAGKSDGKAVCQVESVGEGHGDIPGAEILARAFRHIHGLYHHLVHTE